MKMVFLSKKFNKEDFDCYYRKDGKIYKLYINNELHSSHFMKESVYQVIHKILGLPKERLINDDDFEERP